MLLSILELYMGMDGVLRVHERRDHPTDTDSKILWDSIYTQKVFLRQEYEI